MKITQGIKRTGIYSMLLLFVATTSLSLLPTKAYAAPVDTYSFTDQLVSYKLYFSMADCVSGASLNEDDDGDVTDAVMASGNWYTGSENVITGIVADPQVPADGRMECNTIVRKALSIWGFDDKYGYVETAKKMGFKRSDSGKWSKSSNPRSAMLSFIRSEIYGGNNPAYLKGFNYYDLFKSFINSACQAKKISDGIITTDQKALGYKQITYVDTSTSPGTAKPAVYSFEDETIDYGEAPLAGSDRRLECITIANNLKAPVAEEYVAAFPPGTTPPTDPGIDEGSQSVADECPLPDDTSMRWLGCSIMSLAQVATEKLYGAIQNFLYTPTSMIFENAGLKTAAEGIRNLAIGLIVIAGLVMVIAQATGSELVDAYTLRKLIPRIGVAIIGIALAWPLLRFAITLTNDIGLLADRLLMGVTQLGGGGGGSSNDFGTNVGSTIFGSALAGGTVLILGAMGVISLAGTLLLALLLGLLVLSIRQLVIMVCVLLAPLAIAAYVLPGTQKLWGFWKNTFITSLLMFPIIMFFLASGKAFSAVLGGADSPTMSLLAIIVFIAPYFLLPFAFKLAGGLMATIFSIANDKNRGMFDRLKKGRQNATSNNVNRIKSGSRYAGGTSTNFRGKLNRGLANTALAPGAIMSSGNMISPQNWRAATRSGVQNRNMAEIERNMKENQAYHPWMHDDDLNKAASLTNNAAELRTYLANTGRWDTTTAGGRQDLDDTVAKIESVRRSMGSESFKAMTTRQAVAGGTAFKTDKNATSKTAAGDAWAAVAMASANDEALAGYLVANGRSDGMKAGRIDYAGAGFGTTIGAVNRMRQEYRETGAISQATRERETLEIQKDVYASQGGASLVHSSMKPDAVEEMAPVMVDNIRSVQATGDERKFTQSLASLAAVYDGMQGSSPKKAAIMADKVFSQEFDVSTLSSEMQSRLTSAIRPDPSGAPREKITYQQAIEALRSNNEFREMRREYSSEIDRRLGIPQGEPGQSATPDPGQFGG